ncbi:MAG: hypothetical protein AMXMBFR84_41420 [Candidatus Hydrogenedentota bacterium]
MKMFKRISIVPAVLVSALLSIAWSAHAQPVNDSFAGAEMLWGNITDGNNANATLESGEPAHNSTFTGGKSVWYWWIAPSNAYASFAVDPADDSNGNDLFDPIIAAYTGTTLGGLSQVAEGSYSVDFSPVSGTKYWIAVDGVGGVGSEFQLLHGPSAPDPNIFPLAALSSPVSDSADGGKRVFFEGDGLLRIGIPAVTFGGVPATNVTVTSVSTMHCLAPPHAPGVVDVNVTHPDGTQNFQANAFTYTPIPEPTLDFLSPPEGPVTGGQTITIHGGNFWRNSGSATQVLFDGLPATGVVVSKAWDGVYTIQCKTPPHAAGSVDVQIVNPDLLSTVAENAFLYFVPPPSITQIAPHAGPELGGDSIRIYVHGADSIANPVVTFGGVPATGISTSDGPGGVKYIDCTNPANNESWVDVVVTTESWSIESVNGFAYYDEGSGNSEDAPDQFEVDDWGSSFSTGVDGLILQNYYEEHSFHAAGDVDTVSFQFDSVVIYPTVSLHDMGGSANPVMDIYQDGVLIAESIPELVTKALAAGKSYSVRVRNATPSGFGANHSYQVYVSSSGVGPTTEGYLNVLVKDSLTGRGIPDIKVFAALSSTSLAKELKTTDFNGNCQFTLLAGSYSITAEVPSDFLVTPEPATVIAGSTVQETLTLTRIITPEIHVSNPIAGDQWNWGNSYAIAGTTSTALIAHVNIELMQGAFPVRSVVSYLPVANKAFTFNWSIPNSIPDGVDYWIRVSDAVFSTVHGSSPQFSVGGVLAFDINGIPGPLDSSSQQFDLAVAKSGLGTLQWQTQVLSGSDWISIVSGSPGTNSGLFKVSLTANGTLSDRVGKIKVLQTNADGEPLQKEVTITQKGCSGPGSVTNVQATDTWTDRVHISWSAATGATKYSVYRAEGLNSPSWSAAKVGETSNTNYDDLTALAPVTTGGCNPSTTITYYTYFVRAENSCVQGSFSIGDNGNVAKPNKALYEKAMPADYVDEDTRQAKSGDRLAVRVVAQDSIDLSSIWCMVESVEGVERNTSLEMISDRDGWVAVLPDPAWVPGSGVTVKAGGKTVHGVDLDPVTIKFQIDPDPTRKAGESESHLDSESIPSHLFGIGDVHYIDSDQTFASPQTFWLPLPDGIHPDEAALSYYLKDGERTGWYEGSEIQGWLTSEGVIVETVDGLHYLKFTVNHGGVVQVTLNTEKLIKTSGIGNNITESLCMMLIVVAALVAAHLMQRMSATKGREGGRD